MVLLEEAEEERAEADKALQEVLAQLGLVTRLTNGPILYEDFIETELGYYQLNGRYKNLRNM